MNKTLILGVALALTTAAAVPAGPNRATVGALLGGGAGLVLANNVDGVRAEWAVPVLALAGGWLGHEWDKEIRWRESAPLAVLRLEPAAAPLPAQGQSQGGNPHPGVDLIKVSILNSNGVRTDVNILRTGNRYVGPRGETYESLPTSEELARKYGM